MNNTSGIYLNYQTALSQGYSKFLAEGSSVLVRILKQTSSNTYIASFGGKRFPIKSDIPLSAGSKFWAKVFVSGSRLNLVMTDDKIQNKGSLKDALQNKSPVQSFSTITPEIAEMFASLGLPSDSVSKILMQSVLSLGIKFNIEKINKARAVAQNFPGKEDEAAEAALILLDKGVEPTFENVQDVMTGFFLEKNVSGNSDLKSENFDVLEIEKELKNNKISYLKLTGQTKVSERIELVDKFNEDENIKVFLISLKAGGTGLNLTGADVVIHYDPWWNLSAENQATDRTYRIGQKNNVQVYKLITKNSIEEKIYELQQKKAKLADNMLSTQNTFINQLSKEDIMKLLG